MQKEKKNNGTSAVAEVPFCNASSENTGEDRILKGDRVPVLHQSSGAVQTLIIDVVINGGTSLGTTVCHAVNGVFHPVETILNRVSGILQQRAVVAVASIAGAVVSAVAAAVTAASVTAASVAAVSTAASVIAVVRGAVAYYGAFILASILAIALRCVVFTAARSQSKDQHQGSQKKTQTSFQCVFLL